MDATAQGIGDSFVQLPHEMRALLEAHLESELGRKMRIEARALLLQQAAPNDVAPTAEQVDLVALAKIAATSFGASTKVRQLLALAGGQR